MSVAKIIRIDLDATPAAVKTDKPEGDNWENDAAYLQIREEAIKAFNKKYGFKENNPKGKK